MSIFRYFIVLSFLILFSPMAAHAEGAEAENKAKQIWQLLDYLAVDYGKAVQDGSVRSASEYA